MKILVMNCSPVRSGATAEIAMLVEQGLREANEVRRVCIDDYRIGYCKGCRTCHATAVCPQKDDTEKLVAQFEWADRIVCVSPSYWADIPGQFKAFIDRCTPWCNTHDPHAALSGGKRGYVVALRTGRSAAECQRIIGSVEHFYGHLEIAPCGSLALCAVERREDVADRAGEIADFCKLIAQP